MAHAKFIASIKFLVTPCGSNTLYMIFMNQNYTSGICLIQGSWVDFPNYINALNCGIWMNGFCNNFPHHYRRGIQTFLCDIYYGVTCIKRLLYALEHGHWSDDSKNDMMEAFNFSELYEIARKDPTNTSLVVFSNGIFRYNSNPE